MHVLVLAPASCKRLIEAVLVFRLGSLADKLFGQAKAT